MESALPTKSALLSMGATSSPSSALSSRSRCQERPSASTVANATEIQIAPAATSRPVVGPPNKTGRHQHHAQHGEEPARDDDLARPRLQSRRSLRKTSSTWAPKQKPGEHAAGGEHTSRALVSGGAIA